MKRIFMVTTLLVLISQTSVWAEEFDWKPMDGTQQVKVVQIDSKSVFKMPCNFNGTTFDRASWDSRFQIDMTMANGIEFQFACADMAPVAYFTVYLRSGKGWYASSFMPEGPGKWKTVSVRKDQMRIEGTPAGWSKVDTIRISAWRGLDRNTDIYIDKISPIGTDSKIVIIRNDAAKRHSADEARSVKQFTDIIAGFLDDLQLEYLIVSDEDITTDRLQGKQIVILPHNPYMEKKVIANLAEYLRDGGKLLACYTLPKGLEKVVGITRSAHVKQKYPGHFSAIHPNGSGLPGMPSVTHQASWNISRARPINNGVRIVASWHDQNNNNTGEPAIIASDNCILLTHVLLKDDPVHKKQLLLAMLGSLEKEIWSEAVGNAIVSAGTIGPWKSFQQARQGIQKLAGDSRSAIAALNKAIDQIAQAQKQKKATDYPQAIKSAVLAEKALIDAYCLAQKPLDGEHRAFWCHSAFGVKGTSWDEAVKTLADNGFTAILPNMLWGGVAYYPSDILPTHSDVETRGDQIDLCLQACKKYNIACHVWKVNFNMGWATPDDFIKQMKDAGRVQVSDTGQVEPRWLCPSHPANQKLEIDSMLEVVRKYDVDGIHFDYIRYPGPTWCFCNGCRKRFEKYLGRKIANFPADIKKQPDLNDKWQKFRQANITHVVSTVSSQAKKIRPGVKISAAVFPNWSIDRFGVGQDWNLWCRRGYLDFVCPMDYTPSNDLFESRIEKQLNWNFNVPCYPGIGLSVWDDSTDPVKLIEQINLTRKHKTGGFTIFNYSVNEARIVLPKLGMGITKKK